MITIIADDKIPFLKGILEPYATIRYMDGRDIGPTEVEHADALLVRTRTVCNESLLHGSQVKFIATATIGMDHIDTDYCDTHSIHWTHAPGCNSASVQQYIASVLAGMVFRHGVPLLGKTMGIIGVGNTGTKVESLARLLGMKVLLNDPPRARTEGSTGFVSLEKLLNESDVVTLHVPLNRTGEDTSLHMINEATLKWLKRGAWLINSSRGEVVDEPALKRTLTDGTLSGVVLDVWENEPAIDLQLLEMVALATPHIAGYSTDGKRNGTVHVVRSLAKHFNLPLTDWEPSDIPEPKSPFIVLDCRDQTIEKIVCQAILHTYDVTKDDFRFRASPGDFERLRNIYPLRREFPAYSIILLNEQSPVKEKFLALGFSVL